MPYLVSGNDAETGDCADPVLIDATSESEAMAKAIKQGMVPESAEWIEISIYDKNRMAEAGARLAGIVKWFSTQKGFGYITDNDTGLDHRFAITDVCGNAAPRPGDQVRFEPTNGPKGLRATAIDIIERVSDGDERVECASCGKRMIPRLISYRGAPSKSVCPFCGTTYRDFGWCFIATAVYCDYDAPQVRRLRRFRDEVLMPYAIGRLSIYMYYRISPPVARMIVRYPRVGLTVRWLLDRL